MEAAIYRQIQERVMQELSSSAHDYAHVKRVCKVCSLIAASEPAVKMTILQAAALLHDIAKVKEDMDDSGNTDHAALGAEMARSVLQEAGYTDDVEAIVHCIRTHRFKGSEKPESLEAKILFDADKIDILGAVGIARCFMIAGEYGQAIYSDVPTEDYVKDNLMGGSVRGRIKEIKKHTPNLEFQIKITRIPATLFTQKGREIAEERIQYMLQFFDRLSTEVRC